jgi:short-subunit dehydrogenase
MTRSYEKVLITGASSGIGRGMALWFQKRGATVWATARRKSALDALAAEGEGRIKAVEMDVTKTSQTVAQIQAIDDECGGLDCVIANAGSGDLSPPEATWPEVERILNVNVMGAAATITAVLPRMVKRNRGHVVGVSSISGYFGAGATSCYSGSKAFLSTFLQSIRVDLYGTPVKATCIEPGYVVSDMSSRLVGVTPMPFRAKTEVAVDKFCRAIVRGARVFVFPKVHGWPAKLVPFVPDAIYEPLSKRATEPVRKYYTTHELPAKNL